MSTYDLGSQLTVTLPAEVADILKKKVDSGEFDSPSEALRAGFLHYLTDQQDMTLELGDRAFDDMLRREVLPVLDELDADPTSGLNLDQIRVSLAERRRQ